MKKRVLCIIITIMMLLSLIPTANAVHPNDSAISYGSPDYTTTDASQILFKTQSVNALNEITNIEIMGYCDIIAGNTPYACYNLQTPSNVKYTIYGVAWYCDTDDNYLDAFDVFEVGKKYSLGIELLADSGYCFAEDAKIVLNGGTVDVSIKDSFRDDYDNTIFYVWNMPSESIVPEIISKIEVNNFKEPVVGTKAGNFVAVSVPDNAHYHLEDIYWYNSSFDYYMNDYEYFSNQTNYCLNATVVADSGYIFSQDAQVILNGGTVPLLTSETYRASNDHSIFCICSDPIKPVAPKVINKVEVTGSTTPELGAKAGESLNLSIPPDVHYHLENVRWYNGTTGFDLTSSNVFEYRNSYRLCADVVADIGYVFSEDTQVIMDGENMDAYITSTGSSLYFSSAYMEPPVDPDKIITHIKVNGFRAPIICGVVEDNTNLSVPEGSHYHLEDTYWFNGTTHDYMLEDFIFSAGCVYSLCTSVVADEGYYFADIAEVILNGGREALDATISFDKDRHNRIFVSCMWKEPVESSYTDCGGNRAICPSAPYTDVAAYGNWAHAGIDFCISNGLMNGINENTFNPKGSMTRAMVVTVLWRQAGSPKPTKATSFDDLAQSWYMDAVAWAAENGVVNGVSATRFAPNDPVTREQMATILQRYTGNVLKKDVSKTTDITGYPDYATVSSFAVTPMAWANAEGLITGVSSGGRTTLNPKNGATREQVATILMRFVNNIA